MNRLSNLGFLEFFMRENFKLFLLSATGLLSLIFSFSSFEVQGPWNSPSFSRGVVGLFGIILLYFAWYLFTFGFIGIVPSQTMWKNPHQSTKIVFLVGVWFLIIAQIVQTSLFVDIAPEPTGLILTFIGLLTIFNSAYVTLSQGALSEEE